MLTHQMLKKQKSSYKNKMISLQRKQYWIYTNIQREKFFFEEN